MKRFFSLFNQSVSFIRRQERDWKVTVIRSSLDRFGYQMVFPYLSIYIIALGATATQLGMVNSIGMVMAGLLGPLMGWLIDGIGPKKIYMLGIGLLACAYLTYVIAQDWTITILAMAAYWLGWSISVHSCATVCGNCLANQDRATGMTICETFGAGLLGMLGPVIGAWLVTAFGGVNVAGIRPIFFFSLAVSIATFFLVLTQLSNRRWGAAKKEKPHLLRDLHEVIKEGRHLKRWLAIAAIGQMPMAMVFPFAQVFAHEIKGADQYLLGLMVTASALASIIFSIPLGRFADRVGRKRALFITIPLFWAGNVLLVLAPSPVFLIIAGALQGFFLVGGPIGGAMGRELVPANHMGRWLGISRFVTMTSNAVMALLAGIIWDRVGPQYVFLAFICFEMLVRVPLLISMPETLGMKHEKQQPDYS